VHLTVADLCQLLGPRPRHLWFLSRLIAVLVRNVRRGIFAAGSWSLPLCAVELPVSVGLSLSRSG
jgi:hypothetical protein